MTHLHSGDWITVVDAAELLDVTPRRVQALIATGRLKATKMSARLFLLLRQDVEAFAKLDRPAGRPTAKKPARKPAKKGKK